MEFPLGGIVVGDQRQVPGDGGDSGAKFGVKDCDQVAEEAVGGWSHAIFPTFPFGDLSAVCMEVCTKFVTRETEVSAKETELLPVEAAWAVGQSLGDGAVDLFHSWDQDVFVNAVWAKGSLNSLEDDARQTAFFIAVVDRG